MHVERHSRHVRARWIEIAPCQLSCSELIELGYVTKAEPSWEIPRGDSRVSPLSKGRMLQSHLATSGPPTPALEANGKGTP